MEAFGKSRRPRNVQILVLWSLSPEDYDDKMALLLWNRPEAEECAELGFGQGLEGGAGKQSITTPPPSTSSLLFEMRQEMGNWVVGSVNAQALTDAQQAETGLSRAGPSTRHIAVRLLILARYQGLLQKVESQ